MQEIVNRSVREPARSRRKGRSAPTSLHPPPTRQPPPEFHVAVTVCTRQADAIRPSPTMTAPRAWCRARNQSLSPPDPGVLAQACRSCSTPVQPWKRWWTRRMTLGHVSSGADGRTRHGNILLDKGHPDAHAGRVATGSCRRGRRARISSRTPIAPVGPSSGAPESPLHQPPQLHHRPVRRPPAAGTTFIFVEEFRPCRPPVMDSRLCVRTRAYGSCSGRG